MDPLIRHLHLQANGDVTEVLATVPTNNDLRASDANEEFLFVFVFVPLRLSDDCHYIVGKPPGHHQRFIADK